MGWEELYDREAFRFFFSFSPVLVGHLGLDQEPRKPEFTATAATHMQSQSDSQQVASMNQNRQGARRRQTTSSMHQVPPRLDVFSSFMSAGTGLACVNISQSINQRIDLAQRPMFFVFCSYLRTANFDHPCTRRWRDISLRMKPSSEFICFFMDMRFESPCNTHRVRKVTHSDASARLFSSSLWKGRSPDRTRSPASVRSIAITTCLLTNMRHKCQT